MSIDKEGFLSPEVEAARVRIRANYEKWFALAYRFNLYAQGLADKSDSYPASDDDPGYVMRCLFKRALSNFQGAIVMLERGMLAEARILTRALVEDYLFIDTVKREGRQFALKMSAASDWSAKLLWDDILANPDDYHAESVAAAKRNQNPVSQKTKMSFEGLADDAGIAKAYTAYRELSTDAAHPGQRAFDRYRRRASGVNAGHLILHPTPIEREVEFDLTFQPLLAFIGCTLEPYAAVVYGTEREKRVAADVAGLIDEWSALDDPSIVPRQAR